jgi:hypothetical protein
MALLQGLINYTDTKAFVSIDLQKNFRHLFAILADESVCGIENSYSQGGGQGLVDIRERPVHLLVFYYNKFNIYQILYFAPQEQAYKFIF